MIPDELTHKASETTPHVSVVVPVRDGEQYLGALVTALEQQTLSRAQFEVVIADDGSARLPDAYATADGWIRVLPGGPTNSYAARNRGVAAARGDVIAFCDADCVPEPGWLAEGMAALADTDVVAGRIRFIAPGRRTTWAFVDMETSKNQERWVRYGVAETANLFVRRRLVDAVGGFEETVDEYGDFGFVERCVALGARLKYAPRVIAWHPVRESRSAVLGAHWKYCVGYAERVSRSGERNADLRFRSWLPILPVAWVRARTGLTLLGPDAEWLASNGLRLTWRERVKSLPAIYLVLPYWRTAAFVTGWWRGRVAR